MNILASAFLLAFVTGCGNEIYVPNSPDGDDNAHIGDIIEFGVDISTRGDRINEDETIEEFGVYGYQYSFSENWNGVRALAKPNVFDVSPKTVTLTDGFYAYAPVQSWTGNKYSFFAYYPVGHSNLTSSGATELNTPYVIYTLDDSNVDNLVDVMTGSFINTSVNSSKYVHFEMHHRLSAIDVTAFNFYQEGEDYIDIEILELAIGLTNLKYNKAKIFLDNSIGAVYEEGRGTANYQIVKDTDEPYTVLPNQKNAVEITAENARTMLVIPQETSDLQVETTIKFKKKKNDGNYIEEGGSNEFTETQNTSFGMFLKEGSRYDVQVTFTSAAVSINIVTAAQWDDDPDIDHDFE